MKKMALWLSSSALAGFLAFAFVQPIYAKRLVTYPHFSAITDSAWYEPSDLIPGEPQDLARSSAPLPSQKEALEKAALYAMNRSASAFVVALDGKILLERYAPGFNAASTTNAMSMAKTVVALLTGTLIDSGLIASEEDLVSKYLEEFRDPGRNQIRILDLLQMTSGLAFNDNAILPWSDLAWMHLGGEAEKTALTSPLETPPGTVYRYKNVDPEILSILLERVSRQRFSELLSARLWKPIGAGPAKVWLDREKGTAKTYCCLFATALDWAKIGTLLLWKGLWRTPQGERRVLSEGWIDRMLRPSPLGPDYGYLTWLGLPGKDYPSRSKFQTRLDHSMFYLDGRDRQRVYILPEKKLVIVRVGEGSEDWDDAAIPNILARAFPSIP